MLQVHPDDGCANASFKKTTNLPKHRWTPRLCGLPRSTRRSCPPPPKKQRTAPLEKDKTANDANRDDIDVTNGDGDQVTFNGVALGAMGQNPDLHPRWVGVKVLTPRTLLVRRNGDD